MRDRETKPTWSTCNPHWSMLGWCLALVVIRCMTDLAHSLLICYPCIGGLFNGGLHMLNHHSVLKR